MAKISGKLKIYLYSTLILTALAILLCSACYLFAFDKGIGYFGTGSLLTRIFTSLCALCAIFAFSSVIFIPKGELDGAAPITLANCISSLPICIVSVALGAFMITASLLIDSQSIFSQLYPSFARGHSHIVLLLCGISLIISAIYFAMTWTVKKETREAHALVGFALPVAGLFLIACVYFDLYVAMNSPVKLIFESAMISYMIFCTFDLRVALDKAKPRAYFFVGMLTALLSGIASLPYIIAFAAGVMTNIAYLFYAAFALGVFVYTVSRLFIFVAARDLIERIADQTPSDIDFYELDSENESAPEAAMEIGEKENEEEAPIGDQTEE